MAMRRPWPAMTRPVFAWTTSGSAWPKRRRLADDRVEVLLAVLPGVRGIGDEGCDRHAPDRELHFWHGNLQDEEPSGLVLELVAATRRLGATPELPRLYQRRGTRSLSVKRG